jgi:hypothetical protein
MTTYKINYLAVLVSGVAMYVLGAIWYISFQGPWMELSGLTEEAIVAAGGGVDSYFVSFVTYLLGAYAMALIFEAMKITKMQKGALTGALIGSLIVGGNIFTNNSYELKPMGLSVLNAGFSTVSLTVVGAILGAWKKKA